jgi:regulator of replication initiation timing
LNALYNECESAQSFLTSLNQTLGELHSSLVSTREHSESMNVEFESINQRIGEKLKNLNTQTNKATSITELKQLVENELRSLSADILEKEQLEQT